MYDAVASTIAADADPCHHPTTNPDVTDPNDIAAQCSSEARSSQAAAAANIGADPAPANTLAELTSGQHREIRQHRDGPSSAETAHFHPMR